VDADKPSNGTVLSNDTNVTSNHATVTIQDQYHRIMVGGLELPYPFSSVADSPNHDDNDDDEWFTESSSDTHPANDIHYMILYIGDVTSRPFLNIVLRFLSKGNVAGNDSSSSRHHLVPQPQYHLSSIWAWTPTHASTNNTVIPNPSSGQLHTDVLQNSNSFQKILQRRYYLIQKAKQCTTFGIIVAHMTPDVQAFVKSIQQYIDQQQTLSYYTFVVGKINPTKLANFPEIECFILVACPEHALLQNERELYPIPIITPYELLVAFGNNNNTNINTTNFEWGATPYSTNPNDYWTLSSAMTDLSLTNHGVTNSSSGNNNDKDDDDDAPYFSLITGKYESRTKAATADAATMNNSIVVMPNDSSSNDISTLSTRTDGTIVPFGMYKPTSAAAEFLKQREYQGLVMMTPYEERDGMNDVTSNSVIQPAVLGRTGIASNYNNR
jgi:diphthamide biosynthesis protein 2